MVEIGPFTISIGESLSEETWTAAAEVGVPRALLDRAKRQLKVDGSVALEPLTTNEFAFFEVLAGHTRAVIGRDAVGDAIWGAGQWDVYMLHNLVSRVRKRIAQQGFDADVIVTVPGVGYRLQ